MNELTRTLKLTRNSRDQLYSFWVRLGNVLLLPRRTLAEVVAAFVFTSSPIAVPLQHCRLIGVARAHVV